MTVSAVSSAWHPILLPRFSGGWSSYDRGTAGDGAAHENQDSAHGTGSTGNSGSGAAVEASSDTAFGSGTYGSIVDDANYTIAAGIYDFGTPSSPITDWVGGASLAARPLDTAFDTFMSSRWTQYAADEGGTNKKWRLSNSFACPSRGVSLLWDSTDPRSGVGTRTVGNWGQCSHVFSPGLTQYTKTYITRLAYMAIPTTPAGQIAQLKQIRYISQYLAEGRDPVYDGWTPNMYFTHAPDGTGKIAGNNGVLQPPYGITGTVNFNDANPPNWSPNVGTEILANQVWCLQEFIMIPSTPGVQDGKMEYRCWRLSDGALVANHVWNNIQTYASGETLRYKYINFQTGFFNGDLSSPSINEWANSKFAQSDIFISVESLGRVFITNASTWAASTAWAVQPWSAWTPSGITVKLNQGMHANLNSKYCYVWHPVTGALVNTNGIPLA